MSSQSPQASRRRSQREEPASPEQQQTEPSEDSEYFMLNHSQVDTPSKAESGSPKVPDQLDTPVIAATPTTPPAPLDEVRECWICRQEDTEDTPGSSEWRSPCPCSMQAHESCLLEWITDKESARPGESPMVEDIVCPVCKHQYQIDRPKDYVVIAADRIRKVARGLILPTAASTIIGTVYSGFLIYGMNSLELVFGYEEAKYVMAASARDRAIHANMYSRAWYRGIHQAIRIMDPFLPATDCVANWKLFVGLPLIAPALVLSRTRLADPLFALLPVCYFVWRDDQRGLRDWPPTPAMAFSVLPYIRSAYNQLYGIAFSELEKKWDRAVQRTPREGETVEGIQAANQAANAEDNAIFDLQVIVEEEVAEADIPAEIQERLDQQDQHEQQPEGAPGPQAPRPAGRNQNNWELQQNISTVHVVSTVMGALMFPPISSLMGDLLRLTLPSRLVVKPSSRWSVGGARGILQEKWGRTLIGGCLFVVLKDVVTLYCKWKKAKDFGKRKIVDFKRARK
ncbi:hypothetical protein BP5796_08740 [Coleophoma crateriformis]|uniref:RING-CH-type domain-containing protein n=1 Tax=Coleophoma crateriformis TaxID=565419 RepID=A0A3D8R8G8_9HELO|nr:hypothetical protein BP5796_08740 [Coleophoma crateriformis]